MYGIRNSNRILCNGNVFIFEMKLPGHDSDPVIRESSYAIDVLLQELMVEWGDYSLYVYELSKEQEAELLVRKLRGY